MKIDLDRLEWKKLLFILVAGLSVVPLHIAGFAFALPSPFRAIFDADIKVSIGVDFATNALLFGFFARYFPQFVFGLVGWIHKLKIEAKYYQRGYRRVYVAFAGFGRNARKFASASELQEHFKRCFEFGRSHARFANFLKSDLHKSFDVAFYENHRNSITAILGVSLFVFNYLGLARGLAVIFIASLFAASAIFYAPLSSYFKFNLAPKLWGNSSSPRANEIDADDILLIISSIAVAAVLSGFFRVGFLISSPSLLLDDENAPVSIVVSNSQGILVFREGESFEFRDWPDTLRSY